MVRNTHNIDRIVRAILGVALVVAGLGLQTWLLAGAGLILLGTAAVGWCPLYAIFGISTCPLTPNKS